MEVVIVFITNVMIFGRFGLRMDNDDLKYYPLILQLFVEVVDILTSLEYRECDRACLGEHGYITHTIIAYPFNIFSLFTKGAKNLNAITHVKVRSDLDMTLFKIPIMNQRK